MLDSKVTDKEKYYIDEDELGNINCNNCVNCCYCINCNNCIECTNCTECNNCEQCVSCVSCENCIDCDDCIECFDCASSRFLDKCDNCINCNTQKGLTNLYGCGKNVIESSSEKSENN